mmetsp:Transcript_124970/g.221437  ORF Transcript_124970/g.221437 Transcript_124970/m.221437 type:complete len:110 (-) Transcript_124970:78-407(-)
MAKSMALVLTLSLFLSMHMEGVQATHCPSSDVHELMQIRIHLNATEQQAKDPGQSKQIEQDEGLGSAQRDVTRVRSSTSASPQRTRAAVTMALTHGMDQSGWRSVDPWH